MSARSTLTRVVRSSLVLTILVIPFLVPVSAQAHALLQQSTPADGATYDRAPAAIDLVFTEAVQVAATSVQLFNGAGRPVAVGKAESADGDANSPEIRVSLGQLPKDRYLVRWRTISSDDLHPAAGSIVFGIGVGVSPTAQEDQPAWATLDSAAESVLRWVALMAIGFALACIVLSRRLVVLRTEDVASPILRRSTSTVAAVGVGATAALSLLYLARIVDAGGWVAMFAAWQFTLRWVVAVAAVVAAWWLVRRRRELRRDMVTGVLLVVAIAAVTSSSHPTSAGWATAALGIIHTISTMLWACGAAAVAVVAVPSLRAGDRLRASAVARAFTPLAVILVPVSLVTGLLLAGLLLPSVGSVVNTDYGQALLLKLGLLAAGLLCAGATVWLLVLDGGRRRAALVVGVEAVLLGGVVLAASTLAATHPASRVVWAPTSAQVATAGVLSELVDDLVITADVGPGRPGRNFITVEVLDTRRPAPAPVAKVDVAVDGEPALTAVPQGRYQWLVTTNVNHEGPTGLTVTVTRPGEPLAGATFRWTLGPTVGTRLGGAELLPIANAVALAVALTAVIVGCVLVVVRRRRRQACSRSRSATSASPGWSAETPAARATVSPHGSAPNS